MVALWIRKVITYFFLAVKTDRTRGRVLADLGFCELKQPLCFTAKAVYLELGIIVTFIATYPSFHNILFV